MYVASDNIAVIGTKRWGKTSGGGGGGEQSLHYYFFNTLLELVKHITHEPVTIPCFCQS